MHAALQWPNKWMALYFCMQDSDNCTIFSPPPAYKLFIWGDSGGFLWSSRTSPIQTISLTLSPFLTAFKLIICVELHIFQHSAFSLDYRIARNSSSLSILQCKYTVLYYKWTLGFPWDDVGLAESCSLTTTNIVFQIK